MINTNTLPHLNISVLKSKLLPKVELDLLSQEGFIYPV